MPRHGPIVSGRRAAFIAPSCMELRTRRRCPGSGAPRTERKPDHAARGYVRRAVSRWRDRYLAGQCPQVWTEMTSLGSDLRADEVVAAEAASVASETMRRAR